MWNKAVAKETQGLLLKVKEDGVFDCLCFGNPCHALWSFDGEIPSVVITLVAVNVPANGNGFWTEGKRWISCSKVSDLESDYFD